MSGDILGCHSWVGRYYWHVVGKSQGGCDTCYNVQNGYPQNKELSRPRILMELRWRNASPEHWCCHGTQSKAESVLVEEIGNAFLKQGPLSGSGK